MQCKESTHKLTSAILQPYQQQRSLSHCLWESIKQQCQHPVISLKNNEKTHTHKHSQVHVKAEERDNFHLISQLTLTQK